MLQKLLCLIITVSSHLNINILTVGVAQRVYICCKYDEIT